MGFSLRGLWEGADFWDEEENKQQAIARTQRSQIKNTPVQTIQKPKQSFFNKVRDQFDANTEADYYRRNQEALRNFRVPEVPKLNQSYEQQQKDMGNKRPMTNLGQQIVGNTARFINTGVAAGQEVADTARLLTADATDNSAAWKAANERIKTRQQKQYQANSGLLGAGTIFNNPEEFNTLGAGELAKRVASTTVGTAGEVLPMAKGFSVVGKTKPAIAKAALQGGVASTAADAGQQYISTGKINPVQSGTAFVTGGALTVAPPLTARATTNLVRKSAPVVQKIDQKAFETPQTSAIRDTNKILQQKWDNTPDPIARRQISKQIARNNIELNRQTQIGAVGKNVNDPLESLKQEARKYKSAEEFVNSQIKRHYTTPESAKALREGVEFDYTKAPVHGAGSKSLGNKTGRIVTDDKPAMYLSLDDSKWQKSVSQRNYKPGEVVDLSKMSANEVMDFQKQGGTVGYNYEKQRYEGVPNGRITKDLEAVDYRVDPSASKLVIDSEQSYRKAVQELGTSPEDPQFWSKARQKYDVVEIRNTDKGSQIPENVNKSARRFFNAAKGDQQIILNTDKVKRADTKQLTDLYNQATAPKTVEKPKGFISAETKPLPDGSKVVVRNRKSPETGHMEQYQERVVKADDKPLTGVKDKQLDEYKSVRKQIIKAEIDTIKNEKAPTRDLYKEVLSQGGIGSSAYETLPKYVKRKNGASADKIAQVLGFEDESSFVEALNNYRPKTTNKLSKADIEAEAIDRLEKGSSAFSDDFKDIESRILRRNDELALYPKGTYRQVKIDNRPPKGGLSDNELQSLANNAPFRAYNKPKVTEKLSSFGKKEKKPPKEYDISTDINDLKKSTDQFLGGYSADKTKNMGIARTLPKLDQKTSIDLIDAIEQGGEFKGIPNQVREILDAKHQELTDAGVDIGYLQDYFPHRWKNEAKVRQDYAVLNQRSSIQNPRELPTVKEGVALGFKPATTDYRQAINDYLNTADKLLQNRRYFNDLVDRKLIVESYEVPRGMQVIDAPGLPKPRPFVDPANGVNIQGNYYAPPEIAKKLNRLFGDRSPNGAFEKGLDMTAYASRFLQDIGLAGGVPGTPLNAFTFAQVTKEVMSGSVKNPLVATFKSFTKEGYRKYADKNNEAIQALQRQGIKIRDDYNFKNLGDEITNMIEQEGGKKNAVARGWDKVFSDPTFKRFMPALQIEMFKSVRNKAVKKGMSPEQAEKVAGDAVVNFYGLNRLAKESFRGKAANDAATTVFFAPKYRESMWNFLIVNNAKALNPAKWGAKEYRANQKFMVGAVLLFAGENYANEYLNGVPMWENPDGKKDKLLIPADKIPGNLTNGKDIGLPFLPSIATVPRYAGGAIANTVTGNTEQAVKDASGFLSFGLRPAVDAFVTNENYFGDKIVEEGATPGQALKDRLGYLLTQYQHPYIREGVRTAQGKNKSTFEAISKASEAPLRFYDSKYYTYNGEFNPRGKEGQTFTITEQKNRAKLKSEMKAITTNLGLNKRQQADFEALNAVEFDDDGNLKQENNPFYKSQRATALQDDKVFEAMKQKAQINNKLNGQPIDPIYSVSPEKRRLLLWKDTLPQGTSDPSIKAMYDQEWYQDFRANDSKYYQEKTTWQKKMGYKNNGTASTYPEPSKDLQKKLDYYYTLPKGTGARSSFLRSNPDILAQWDKVEAWKNGERLKVGLGELPDEFSSNGYSRSGGRKGGRKGRKGKKKSYKMFAYGDPVSTTKSLRELVNDAKLS